MNKMPKSVHKKMWQDSVPQTMHVFLSKMLCLVPLCPSWLLWQQSCVPCYNNWKTKRGEPKCP
ncbi:hypothetical protein PTKIN_Ptkin04bG0070200 [Pterospermum kingtungense]